MEQFAGGHKSAINTNKLRKGKEICAAELHVVSAQSQPGQDVAITSKSHLKVSPRKIAAKGIKMIQSSQDSLAKCLVRSNFKSKNLSWAPVCAFGTPFPQASWSPAK
jgi:hypothetical protein